MTRSNRFVALLVVLCTFQAGWILGGIFAPIAHAEPSPDAPTAPSSEWVYHCKLFQADPTKDDVLDTDNNTTEAGRWVRGERKRGWSLAQLDFEVGQKSTGYPQGWTQICVRRLDDK